MIFRFTKTAEPLLPVPETGNRKRERMPSVRGVEAQNDANQHQDDDDRSDHEFGYAQ